MTELKEAIAILEKEQYLKDGEWIRTSGVEKALALLRAEQPSAGDFTKNIRDTLEVMSSDAKFHRKIMEKALDIIDTETQEKRLWKARVDEAAKYIEDYEEIKAKLDTETQRADKAQILNQPHLESANCPTYHDGCHCTIETLIHNIERADKLEASRKDLLEALEELAATFVGLTEGSIGGQAMKKANAAIEKIKKEGD